MRPLLCAALIALAGPATAAPPSAVPLTADAGGAKRVSGTLKGYRLADYRLPLEAGQTVRLELRTGKPAAYFNLQAPGADAGAMFIGSIAGERFDTVAPVSGDYLLRVYLMRSAARRNELARYTLSVQAGAHPGKAAAGDALVAGTPYHATASIRCMPAGGPVSDITDFGYLPTEGYLPLRHSLACPSQVEKVWERKKPPPPRPAPP